MSRGNTVLANMSGDAYVLEEPRRDLIVFSITALNYRKLGRSAEVEAEIVVACRAGEFMFVF